jgi:EcsC protein family
MPSVAESEASMQLTPYEQKALEETEVYFREPEESLLGRASRSLFKPIETLSERLIPDRVLEVAGNGVEKILKGIATLSDQTVHTQSVVQAVRARGAKVESIEDLRRADLATLDQVSADIADQHEVVAMLEGAGCGVGGLALIAADIPLLFGVAQRVVRQVGAVYGFEPDAPGEGVIAFKVFELASGGTRDRYAELLELENLCDELDGLEPSKRAEKATVLASLIMSRETVRTLVQRLFSRKLFQALPVAGMLVGAGFNYMFLSDVSEAARMVYRRRWLQDKQRAPEAE